MSPNLAPVPPHSIEAEQAVLGALLLDGNAFDRVVDILTASDFYGADHEAIFTAIQRLHDQGRPADVVTVSEALSAAGEDPLGTFASLAELAANVPGATNIRHYAEIVRAKSLLRGLLGVSRWLQDACLQPGVSNAQQIALDAEASMLSLVDRQGGEPRAIAEVLGEAMAYVDERCQRDSQCQGLTTGCDGFDQLTGGLEPGQLVIVAARPSVGKTIFACNVADHLARLGGSVLFLTLEMSAREIGMRILSARSRVSVHAMRTGTKDETHWNSMNQEVVRAAPERLFIDDKGAIGVGYVRAKARRIKRQRGLDLIVIDYLGLMKGQGDNRTQEIGGISRGLKALAKELGVPIMCLAQLNRGVESRPDKRPTLADLRDSGEIEQDADIVAFLHREALYAQTPEWEGLAELLIRKNRNGPLGEVLLSYQPEAMLFGPYSGPNPRVGGQAAGQGRRPFARGFPE